MKRMLLALGIAILTSASASAGWDWTPETGWVLTQESVLRSVVVPPGHHAHIVQDADGTRRTIIHADSNRGSAAAHAGVLGDGWPKTAYAGQTVSLDTVAAAQPTQYVAVTSGPRGPVRRIFGLIFHRAAERRAARQNVATVETSYVETVASVAVAVTAPAAPTLQACPGGVCPPSRSRRR